MNNSTSNDVINVSSHLRRMGRLKPFQRAVVYPSNRDRAGRVAYSHLTFLQLDQEADRIAHGLNSIGIVRGTRVVVMMKPSLEFFTVLFSLFRMGAVPVMADADLGIRRMLMCFEKSGAEALIGTPIAHFYRKIYPKYFISYRDFRSFGRSQYRPLFSPLWRNEDCTDYPCNNDSFHCLFIQ